MSRASSHNPKSRRRPSSHRWLERQRRDPFARKARSEGRGSRAHYKLAQLDARYRLVRPGMRVLELGGAPGGWTRYLESRLAGGRLIVCDPLPVKAVADTIVIRGCYGEAAVDAAIRAHLGEGKVDLVLSDMAPNITGIRATDQARSVELAELALDAARGRLIRGGAMVVKLFQGAGADDWLVDARKLFVKMSLAKPEASRPASREVYAVGQQFLVTR